MLKKLNLTKNRALAATCGAGLALAVALTGCSSHSDSQSGSAGRPPEPPKITIGDAFVYPTNLEVPGLTGQRILSTTGSEARWSYLPGEQPFNPALAALIGEHLQHQAASTGATYSPQAHDPSADLLNRGCVSGSTSRPAREILDDPSLSLTPGAETQLTITCEPVLAAGPTFGERLRFVRGNSSDVVSDFVEVLYTNTETGEVARGKDLVAESGLPALLDALYTGLKLQRPMSGDEVLPPSPETLSDLAQSIYNVGFSENGDIHATVDGHFTSVLAAGDQGYTPKSETLVIPAERAEELLTPLGASISAAQQSGAAWSGPAPLKPGLEYVDCNLVPCVAVTYDDGPSPYTTQTVLDAYAGKPYAAATFFVLGENIAGNEAVLASEAAEGHLVANHSWNHPTFTTLSDEAIAAQVNDTSAAIEAATGVPVTYIRPPYGDMNERTRAVAGLPTILWSIDTNDWQQPGTDAIVSQVLSETVPDSIVLMHDIHEQTVAGAAQIVDGLLERGYTLVTVNQLFGGTSPDPTLFFWDTDAVRAARHQR